ncbi:MAG TPA: hypothetical protein VGD59_07590 [Acidisarcina sp.]
MPVSEKDFRELSNSVSTMQGSLRAWSKVAASLSVLALTAGTGALTWCYHLGTVVAVLETGGNTKLITELESPKSPDELRASLTMVTAQLRTARVNNVRLNGDKIAVLYGALDRVVRRNADVPEGWQAVSAAVNLRPITDIPPEIAALEGPPIPNVGNCYQRPMTYNDAQDAHIPDGGSLTSNVILHDCTLVLDDIAGFNQSNPMQHALKRFNPGHEDIAFALTLVRVKVEYRGGPIIPVISLKLYGCTFDVDVPSEPPPIGKAFLEALLSDDPNKNLETVTLPRRLT